MQNNEKPNIDKEPNHKNTIRFVKAIRMHILSNN